MASVVEQKIIAKIQDDALVQIIDDEGVLDELVRTAIHEAIMQPQRVQRTYGGWDAKDSPVVAAAREAATKAATRIAADMFEDLRGDWEFQKAVRHAMVMALPKIIEDMWKQQFTTQFNMALEDVKRAMNRAQ